MSIVDFSSVLYDAAHTILGSSASLYPKDIAECVTVTAIDKTRGVEVFDEGLEVQTIKPACTIRMSELLTAEIEPRDLDGGLIELNGKSWRIENYQTRPTANGTTDGEVMLFLIEDVT